MTLGHDDSTINIVMAIIIIIIIAILLLLYRLYGRTDRQTDPAQL